MWCGVAQALAASLRRSRRMAWPAGWCQVRSNTTSRHAQCTAPGKPTSFMHMFACKLALTHLWLGKPCPCHACRAPEMPMHSVSRCRARACAGESGSSLSSVSFFYVSVELTQVGMGGTARHHMHACMQLVVSNAWRYAAKCSSKFW